MHSSLSHWEHRATTIAAQRSDNYFNKYTYNLKRWTNCGERLICTVVRFVQFKQVGPLLNW